MYHYFIVFLISSVKFFVAFPIALQYHFNWLSIFITTSLGGITGILCFAFLSYEIIKMYDWFRKKFFKNKPPKKKSVSIRKKRVYIKIKSQFGLWGIAILTPFILSIPIGTFLAVRFFGATKKTILILIFFLIFWAFVLSLISEYTALLVF